jgi:hypothetical protein
MAFLELTGKLKRNIIATRCNKDELLFYAKRKRAANHSTP